jgi:hypothetical protein
MHVRTNSFKHARRHYLPTQKRAAFAVTCHVYGTSCCLNRSKAPASRKPNHVHLATDNRECAFSLLSAMAVYVLQAAYLSKRQSDLLPSSMTALPCSSKFPGLPGPGAQVVSSKTVTVSIAATVGASTCLWMAAVWVLNIYCASLCSKAKQHYHCQYQCPISYIHNTADLRLRPSGPAGQPCTASRPSHHIHERSDGDMLCCTGECHICRGSHRANAAQGRSQVAQHRSDTICVDGAASAAAGAYRQHKQSKDGTTCTH